MNMDDARTTATQLLELIIENQPQMFVGSVNDAQKRGAHVAEFCDGFIETYAAALVKRDVK